MRKPPKPLSDGQGLLPGMAGAREVRARRRADGTRENPETVVTRGARNWFAQPSVERMVWAQRVHAGKWCFAGHWFNGADADTPDFVGHLRTSPPRPLVCEAKREGGRVRPGQAALLGRLEADGLIVIVFESVPDLAAQIRAAWNRFGGHEKTEYASDVIARTT